MTALVTAAPRLRKLLLMLSSDQDGEVISAARAIGRALADAGADWHALADAILRNDARVRRLPRDDWRAMAMHCREQGHRLSPKEFSLVANLCMNSRPPSPKQLQWLLDIYERVRT